ncbi:hypothetical protein AB0I28_04380 [Phytomonospora sp. NPDC050363]|uniref:hypothetical protein n=1 Tax=Phytomonospora sp. NPDC050363 TaxID=3155642 RepID=UPI00340D63FB
MTASPAPSRLLLTGLASWLAFAVIAPPLAGAGMPNPPVLARDTTPGHPVTLTTGDGIGDWIAFYADLLPVTIACGVLALIAATGLTAAHTLTGKIAGPLFFPLAMLWPAGPLTALLNPDHPAWPTAYLPSGALLVLLACQYVAGNAYVQAVTYAKKPPTATAVEGTA